MCTKIVSIAAMWATCLGAVAALGTQRPPPRASIFASEFGRYAAKTSITDRWSAVATLFSLNEDGSENVVWSRDLGYVPHRLLVSDYGWVVGLNEYASNTYAHALVIWSPEGQLLGNYRLEELLTADEIGLVPSRTWWKGARFQFEHDALHGRYDRLTADLSWGRLLVADLRTGKVQTFGPASSLPAPMSGFSDDAVFLDYRGDELLGEVASEWREDGTFKCEGTVFRGRKQYYELEITPADDGRWKNVSLRLGDCTTGMTREETLVRSPEEKPTAVMCLKPRSIICDSDYAPALRSQMIRLYDREGAGDQPFSLITPHMQMFDGTLRHLDSRRMDVGDRDKEFHRYASEGSIIWSDDSGRVYLIENSQHHTSCVRKGYEFLRQRAAASPPGEN